MGLSREREDDRVSIPATSFFKDKDRIKYKKGFTNADIDTRHKTSGVYTKIFFRLLELMIMDVLEGHVVYLNKRTKARFYVDYRDVLLKNVISAEKLAKPHIPRVDLTLTKMRTPIIAFDSGHANSSLCFVRIPEYLYIDMINKVNSGKKFSRGKKEFWFNRKRNM